MVAMWMVAVLACRGADPATEEGVNRGSFTELGVPVRVAGLMGVLVGPGPAEGSERIYFNFRQDGGKLFLVAVDPDTGESQQFQSPVGTGAWGFIVGPDEKIYLGTHEGPDPGDSGQILVFDPKHPEKAIQVVGRPSETETYIWMFTIGHDGILYGCTYGNAKLVSYDPRTGQLADLGVMDNTQQYTRQICTGPDGRIFLGIGYGRANVVVYDPQTGEHKSILPEAYRSHTDQVVAGVYAGVDGNVYINATKMVPGDEGKLAPKSVTLLVKGDGVEETDAPAPPVSHTRLRDGRVVTNATLRGTYTLVHPDGAQENRKFEYQGAGAGIFMVSNGPLSRIYGGSYMPNEIFWYDPATGAMENPGNPTDVTGEIYSMLDYGGALYICAYPGSFLSKWDPGKPWNYGYDPENNPRAFGPIGPGHLRPRAMILGPDGMIYIGSYPEYGKHGGALGVWDPSADKLTANFHPLVTNQAIVSLVDDPETGLVFGGSSTAGGGGTSPIEPEAKFFAFDTARQTLAFEEVPWPGEQSIRSLERVGRRVVGVAGGDKLFVYDIDKKEFVHKAELGLGTVLDCCLKLWTDGQLYGLTASAVFRLDAQTYEAAVLAPYGGRIRCGIALDEHGIYFGDAATLVRYNWPSAARGAETSLESGKVSLPVSMASSRG